MLFQPVSAETGNLPVKQQRVFIRDEQRQMRLIGQYVLLHLLLLRLSNVRRITDNYILHHRHRLLELLHLQYIRLQTGDSHVIPLRIPPCHLQRRLRNIKRRHARFGQMLFQRDGDAPAPRPYVQHPNTRRLAVGCLCQNTIYQLLRFRAGNQNRRIDFEQQAEKIGRTQYILNRLHLP